MSKTTKKPNAVPKTVEIPSHIEAAIIRASETWRVPARILRVLYASAHKRPPAPCNVLGLFERDRFVPFPSEALCIDRAAVAIAQAVLEGADISTAQAAAKSLSTRFPKATVNDYTLYQEA